MKSLIKAVSVIGLFSLGGAAYADQCPDHLNADDMYDCIVVEGAGGTYKGKEASDAKQEASKSTTRNRTDQQAMSEKTNHHADL